MNDLLFGFNQILATSEVTASYQEATIIGPHQVEGIEQPSDANQGMLLVDIGDLGNLTTIEIEVATSYDGTTFFKDVYAENDGGFQKISVAPLQFSVADQYRIPIQLKDNWIRIRYKGTGGDGTGSELSLGLVVAEA